MRIRCFNNQDSECAVFEDCGTLEIFFQKVYGKMKVSEVLLERDVFDKTMWDCHVMIGHGYYETYCQFADFTVLIMNEEMLCS